jgi:hypothetical protein
MPAPLVIFVADKDTGVANSINCIMRTMGGSVGTAIVITISRARHRSPSCRRRSSHRWLPGYSGDARSQPAQTRQVGHCHANQPPICRRRRVNATKENQR